MDCKCGHDHEKYKFYPGDCDCQNPKCKYFTDKGQ